MWASIVGALRSLGEAISAIFSYLSQERLLDAGAAEERERQWGERLERDQLATEIRLKPTPEKLDDTLSRL